MDKWIVVGVVLLVAFAGALGGVFYVLGSEDSTNGDQESPGSVEVTNLALSKDIDGYDPVNKATVFEDDETVHLTGEVKNTEEDMEIYTNWYDENGELIYTWEDDPLVIDEAKNNLPIKFHLAPSEGTWSLGDYSIELVIDEEVVKTLEYEIVGGNGGTNSFEESHDPEMIEDVALSKNAENYEPVNVTRTFQTDDAVYTTGTVQNAEVGMEIYFKIYNDEGELLYTLPEEYRLVLEEYNINDGTTDVSLYITPEAIDWKPGTYWKEILIDGETAATLKFEME